MAPPGGARRWDRLGRGGGAARGLTWSWWAAQAATRSVFEHLLLLLGQRGVDVGLGGLRGPIELLLGAGELVLGELTVLLERLQLLAGGAAQVADRDAAVLGHAPDAP